MSKILQADLSVLENLGFGVHPTKSHLVSDSFPISRRYQRTPQNSVTTIKALYLTLKLLTQALKQAHPLTAMHVSQVIGLLKQVTELIFWARLRIRPIQWFLSSQWDNCKKTIAVLLEEFRWQTIYCFLDPTNLFSSVLI